MKKALVIDGNSLSYRMFYATYKLAEYATTHNLFPVNAVKLMIDTCFKLRENSHYDYCLVAFDSAKKTFRHETFADYKANRKAMPNELVLQMPLIQDALKWMGFNIILKEGIEADDFIGSFANLMTKNDVEVDVYSSDKDMLQLVNSLCNVNLIKSGLSDIQVNNLSNFSILNYGLEPKQIPDYKAIVGDSSDNLSGVKGIGIKTGIKLLEKYKTLEEIYLHLPELTPVNQKKFLDSKDNAFMCKQLATIDIHQLDDYSIDQFNFKPTNYTELKNLFLKYKINGLNKYLKEDNSLFTE